MTVVSTRSLTELLIPKGPMPDPESGVRSSDEGTGRPRVLVIDDDDDLREMIRFVLTEEGYEVITAENGRVGVAIAMDVAPDLVLCDVQMPELDGHSTLTSLRSAPTTARVPFVFLSGGATRQDVRRGMNLGADDYLVKPFTAEELREAVKVRLARHAQTEAALAPPPPPPPAPAFAATVALPFSGLGGTETPMVAGRYRLLARGGEGGMGTVYRALDTVRNDTVAVKLVAVHASSDARFQRECESLAQLDHPRVVRYRDHGIAVDGYHFLVMDWLAGIDLADHLVKGALTVDDSVVFLRHATDALAYLHANGIVHRDIKPSNFFLVNHEFEGVTLIDLGLARGTESAPLTQSGLLVGTPGYLAPEQVQGRSAPDARSDVFALGCVTYECLTGISPFGAPTAVAAIAKLLLEEVPRVSATRPDVPPALDELVARMMHRDPTVRFADAEAVRTALSTLSS